MVKAGCECRTAIGADGLLALADLIEAAHAFKRTRLGREENDANDPKVWGMVIALS
jgi:hypothetical protein